MNADETAVASILKHYQTALNGSDTQAVLKLYTPDGVFMPQHSPSSVGTAALRQAYDAVFAAITLTVESEIAADAAALRLQRAHDAVAAVDAGDYLVCSVSDCVADARLDALVELREPAVDLRQDIGVAHPAH